MTSFFSYLNLAAAKFSTATLINIKHLIKFSTLYMRTSPLSMLFPTNFCKVSDIKQSFYVILKFKHLPLIYKLISYNIMFYIILEKIVPSQSKPDLYIFASMWCDNLTLQTKLDDCAISLIGKIFFSIPFTCYTF